MSKFTPKFTIGDLHGIPDETEELIQWARDQGIPYHDIWILGDLLDRGPDSGACVRMCRRMGVKSILGNHEKSIMNRWDAKLKGNPMRHPNPDKEKTISQLKQEDIEWLAKLPPIHVFDENKLILVHGGVWPHVPLYRQPHNVIRAQMIQPFNPGPSRWWGPKAKDGCKHSEEESVEQGWRRWYEVYDHKYDIAFGHSVFQCPLVYKNPDSGTVFGLDTGAVFGGWLTGMIHDGPGNYHIKQVRAKKVYCVDMLKQFGEINE
jgi:calcineurin-like phosphoesterase family protein